MARDIEEFLRRAAERRQQQKSQQGRSAPQQKQPPAQPPRRPLVPIEEIEVEIVEPTIVSRPARRSGQQPTESPIARQKLQSEMRKESVAQHVDRHLNTNRISEKSKKLGQRVASVHDVVDERVHQHLDHDISSIDDRPTVTDDRRPGVVGSDRSKIAANLLQFLSQPESIRQAIIVAEILKRPDFDDEI
jgi:hypothetical protein